MVPRDSLSTDSQRSFGPSTQKVTNHCAESPVGSGSMSSVSLQLPPCRWRTPVEPRNQTSSALKTWTFTSPSAGAPAGGVTGCQPLASR